MNNVKAINFIALLVCVWTTGAAQHKLHLSPRMVDEAIHFSKQQIGHLAKNTPDDKFPRTFEGNKHIHSNSSWWCSGFYPGTLLYLYEGTGDSTLLYLAKNKLKHLAKEQYNKGTHDLGFMLQCSFGNALRLTGDSTAYKDVLSTGAASLASRYSSQVECIRSWDWKPWHYPVIIDNMMNLEFLMHCSKISANPQLRAIAISHANTTLKNHFRPDYSSFHVIDYDKITGEVIAKKTHQGAFDESAWARGQGWALYGYTMMYRETKNLTYLNMAQHIAEYILNHPNLPDDLIPYWDFDIDKIDASYPFFEQRKLRDVSAASLYASALLELSQYVNIKAGNKYLRKAEILIQNLSSDTYRSALGDNGGYILGHSVGALPFGSEVDVPLTYADYYYVESLIRYQRLLNGQPVVKI